MSDDEDWRRRMLTSSADLSELRARWRDAGQEAWDAATRLGKDIKARTSQELEALGRQQFEAAERQQAATDAVGKAVGSAALLPLRIARPGTETDPGPGRLAAEWALGSGPERRILGLDSSFSREFVQAPSVQDYVRRQTGAWRQANGIQGSYTPDTRATFGPKQFVEDGLAANGAAHFVGSWGVSGARRGEGIDWQAENDSDTTSFFGGTPLRAAGLPVVPSYARPWPGGRTHQSIQFRTDLNGRPLSDSH